MDLMDLLLIGMTLALAIIGTLWRDPPTSAKIALVGLLVASSAVSLFKSMADARDKALLQELSIAGLALPDSAYDKVFQLIDNAMKTAGYADGGYCHHTNDGMTCTVNHAKSKPDETLVVDRYEISKMYASYLRNDKNLTYVKGVINAEYNPEDRTEDYKDKLGILGYDDFYYICSVDPSGYSYDDDRGIVIMFSDGGQEKRIVMTPSEMTAPSKAPGPILFHHFDELWRDKIRAAMPQCSVGSTTN